MTKLRKDGSGHTGFSRETADLKLIYLAYFSARVLCLALANLEGISSGKLNRYEQASDILNVLVTRFPVTLTQEQIKKISQAASRFHDSIMSGEFQVEEVF